MLNSLDIKKYGMFYIREFGDPGLVRVTKPVDEFDGELRLVIDSMKRFLEGDAIGLAANQVGIDKQIFVWKDRSGHRKELINPQIIDWSNETYYGWEGCLSFPGWQFKIERWKTSTIRGHDIDGKEVFYQGKGLYSQLFQHEMDHLMGRLPAAIAVEYKKL